MHVLIPVSVSTFIPASTYYVCSFQQVRTCVRCSEKVRVFVVASVCTPLHMILVMSLYASVRLLGRLTAGASEVCVIRKGREALVGQMNSFLNAKAPPLAPQSEKE